MGKRNTRRGRAGVIPKPKTPNVDGLKFSELTKEQKVERIKKHGITPEMLVEASDEAYWAGYNAAGEGVTRTVYAALMLVLHDEFGFGNKRMLKALTALDEYVKVHATDGEEEVAEVYRRFGIAVRFKGDELFDSRVDMLLEEEG